MQNIQKSLCHALENVTLCIAVGKFVNYARLILTDLSLLLSVQLSVMPLDSSAAVP